MPDVRHDHLSTRWVIVAEHRAGRPNEFIAARAGRRTGRCVFCPGSEADTPPELLVRRPANWNGDERAWRIRVISNLFPAVDESAAGDLPIEGGGLFRRDATFGVHEVVVDTAEHVVSIAETSEALAEELFDVYRERLLAMRSKERIASALIFKNVGAAAGASIEHAHSQILATPTPVNDLGVELRVAREFFATHGVCPYCRTIEEEIASGVRIVEEHELAVAICPFASRFPHETWVLPRPHESHIESGNDDVLRAVARLTRRAVARLESTLDRPAYNYVVHSAPLNAPRSADYHWHVELYPRVTTLAGFEVGGGCYINPVSPERAAERLRSALP